MYLLCCLQENEEEMLIHVSKLLHKLREATFHIQWWIKIKESYRDSKRKIDNEDRTLYMVTKEREAGGISGWLGCLKWDGMQATLS